MLTSDEWDFLQELIIILGPFEEATSYLGGEKYITYSIMAPIIEQVKNLLLSSNSQPSSSILPVFNSPEILKEIENADDVFVIIEQVEIQENENIVKKNNNQIQNKIDLNKPFETRNVLDEVKENLYNAMCCYWECTSDDNLLATILDPRVKSMGNKSEEKELLRKHYEDYHENYLPTPVESRTASPTPSESTDPIYKPKLFSIFEKNQPKASDEVVEYLSEDKIPFTQCPFNWWLNKKNKYPVLAKMARVFLAIPATSTSSERLFSDAGNLITSKRSRIDSELFKRMMFLKRNATKVASIHK
jgi:hypothetical protein